ncbi:MAG: SDR family oxidoreductase [Pseudolabrys sp.]|nr:SDR family oxidoreductase [Pseudolabrys sp.]
MLQPITLITGASSGIGAELARVFARHGHAIALTARREDRLRQLANEIASAGGKPPNVIAADLEAHDASARLAQTLSERGLEPEIVVNNAGFGLAGDAADLDLTEQLKMIDLNARALTDLSLRFIDSLARHRGGILNVASIASFMPGPGLAVYHATKAYVLSFGEALGAELKPRGVRVSTLCPGPVPTEFDARAGFAPDAFPRILERSAERVAREGYERFMRGDRVIVPGTPNKAMTWLARFLPTSIVMALADRRRQ